MQYSEGLRDLNCKMIICKLLLIVILHQVILHGQKSNSDVDSCDESQSMKVRLNGGTAHAGLVEICWHEGGENDEYRWFSVCTKHWGIAETIAACKQLNYTNNSRIGKMAV